MEKQFNVGDLVWAKVSGHPWWPSMVYHEDLSGTEIQQPKKESFLLISFFGDNTYTWLDPQNVRPFESNYTWYSNKSRSDSFLKAVSEAVYEVNYRAAIGLTCPCSFFSHYRRVKDFVEVDIDGYNLGGVFTVKQIEWFRQEFKPTETLTFIQQLALMDPTNVNDDLNHSKEVARVLAFRKATYAEVDEPFFHAFGFEPRRPGDPIVIMESQAQTDHQSEAESQGQRRPKVKHQNKKPSYNQKDKVHASKAKHLEKKDHAPKKKKGSTSEVDKEHDVTSSATFVKEQPASSCSKRKDSAPKPKPKPLKKRQISISTMPENSTAVEKHQVGPRMMISMRFPPGATLPSDSELEAKFARFGPLDTSSIRFCWVQSRCSLAFTYRSDAEEAYEHAIHNEELFGQTKVHYGLQPEKSISDYICNNRPQVNPIIRQYQEIYAKYREEVVGRTHVQVGHGSIDISKKMLYLLNECGRIVAEV